MKKGEREIARALQRAGLSSDWNPGGKHWIVSVWKCDPVRAVTVQVPYSPKCPEATLQRLKHDLRQKGVDLSPQRA